MNQKTKSAASHIPRKAASIIVSVEFGQRLPNGNCGYIGICSTADATLPGWAPLPRHRRCSRAIAAVSACDEGRAIFFFPHNNMLPCTARAFFSGPTFLIPETYELPVQWQGDLPKLKSFTITAGQYLIEKNEMGFLIRF